MDTSAYGGEPSDQIAVHALVRGHPFETPETVWDAHGQLTLDERIEPPDINSLPDIDHPNSIDIDADGNYLVSLRNIGEVRSIDPSGRTLWRLGGPASDFVFAGDPLGGFSAQHCARALPGGHVLLFDNGWRHSPSQTRAAEYAIDHNAMTATLVWEYRHDPPIFITFTGSVQRLSNGNTLVGFSQAGLVDEVTPDGKLVRELALQNASGDPLWFYRAFAVPSLYEYRVP
jgi:hypothetical protein